ncbi:MAG: hypothetical protein AAFY73_05930 [Pseudomonadota bacterium]
MLKVGLIGMAVTALLGMTPLLSAIGLPESSAQFVANLALTLFGFFLAISLIGLLRRRR